MKKTATKKQVTEFANKHNIDWFVVPDKGANEWYFSIELDEPYEDDDEHEVLCGTIDIEIHPIAGERWFLILEEMKELLKSF